LRLEREKNKCPRREKKGMQRSADVKRGLVWRGFYSRNIEQSHKESI
jgi:hypothetical protein